MNLNEHGPTHLVEHGCLQTQFIIGVAAVTFADDSVGSFSSYMQGLQEGMLFMREHPLQAGRVLDEFIVDQNSWNPEMVKLMRVTVDAYASGRAPSDEDYHRHDLEPNLGG